MRCSCFRIRSAERFRRVVILDRDARLQHDRPGIEILVHEMHRASRKFRAMLDRLPLRLQARKRGQQRRMNIQDPIRKRRNEMRRKQPHVACETNQVDVCLLQLRHHQFVISLALQSLRGNRLRRDASFDRLLRGPARPRDCSAQSQFRHPEFVRRPRYRQALQNSSRAPKAARQCVFSCLTNASIVRSAHQPAAAAVRCALT